MDKEKMVVWAINLTEHGQRRIQLDYPRHSAPEEAIAAFVEQTGIPWAAHESRGARDVRQELTILPPNE